LLTFFQYNRLLNCGVRKKKKEATGEGAGLKVFGRESRCVLTPRTDFFKTKAWSSQATEAKKSEGERKERTLKATSSIQKGKQQQKEKRDRRGSPSNLCANKPIFGKGDGGRKIRCTQRT